VTLGVSHRAGISWLTRVERHACVDGTYSPVRDFTGLVMFIGRWGCHGRDCEVILVESRGNGAPAQEGLPQSLPVGVLPICVWSPLYFSRCLP
jgi:hypothetical protein